MRILIKYFLWFLSLLTIVFFYFSNTSVGHTNLAYLLENYLSKKTHNNIKIDSLNLQKYPYVVIDLTINKDANLFFKGEMNHSNMDMSYHLKGKKFKFNNIYIEDNINIKGSLFGAFSELLVKGKGKLFEGNIVFEFTKNPKKIKDMTMSMKSVNSQKILKFLKKPPILEGKVDIDAEFKSFSNPLNSKIYFEDIAYKYRGKINSKIGTLRVENGEYQQRTKTLQADYELHLKDLAYFEKFLKHKYIGGVDANGSLLYNDELIVKGHTTTFGGELEYVYKKKSINLNFKGVCLESLLAHSSYPILLRANLFGTINYDMKDKIVLINTKLRKTRFLQTKMTNMIYNATGINFLSGEYNKSTFIGGYQNQLLYSEFKIDDGISHLYLLNTKMNARNNNVNSKFELKMQGQEVYGDISGTLQDPKVSVNVSRLLTYQMKKQMSSLLGIERSEVVKKELKSVKKDVVSKLTEIDTDDVTDKAKSLINGFFK